MVHRDEATGTGALNGKPRRGAISVWTIAVLMLGAIAAFFLLREHWGHVLGFWPYLILLACPLMHLLHHGGHRHGDTADPQRSS